MSFTVAPFEGSAHDWDAFVRNAPGWTHFHLYGWKRVMETALGHDCRYLVATEGNGSGAGRIAGVLPLVRVKSWLFGHYLVSMPFLNYGGPLGSEGAVTALTAHAGDLARAERAKLLELRSRTELPISLPVSHRKLTVVLELEPGKPEAPWGGINSRLRSYIRKSEKAGVTVRFGRDQVEAFYRVFSKHMRELGTPTHARRLFDTIAETFGDEAWFGVAYHNEQPVAGGCGLRWGDEIEVTWASALNVSPELRPNAVLYWAFIKRAGELGLRRFNFGRSSPGSGTHEFKRRWGSHDEPLWWYGQSVGGTAQTPSPTSGLFAWGPKIWSRLPERLTLALGPTIVRLLP